MSMKTWKDKVTIAFSCVYIFLLLDFFNFDCQILKVCQI